MKQAPDMKTGAAQPKNAFADQRWPAAALARMFSALPQ
jgi:hypothetical protein